ncbi:hypothetical protein [Lysobacter sp. HA18]
MDDDAKRKVAVNAASAVVAVGIVMFFFANSSTASMPAQDRAIAAAVGVVVSLIAVRLYFRKRKM